jgi:AcrR family transcriptional regulator
MNHDSQKKKGGVVMPKIIKDVDKILQNCAMNLFITYGYLNVDMKMISEKSGIAVGTLYHYYENKQQLYLSVLNESWAETFDKLNEISISDCTTDEKLHKLIFTLYYDIKERNGLGKVLLDNSVEELKANRCFSELKEKLFASVCEIISNLDMEIIESLPEDITMRLTESLLVSIVAMIEFHPDKDDDNISFLEYLLKIKTITKS